MGATIGEGRQIAEGYLLTWLPHERDQLAELPTTRTLGLRKPAVEPERDDLVIGRGL